MRNEMRKVNKYRRKLKQKYTFISSLINAKFIFLFF